MPLRDVTSWRGGPTWPHPPPRQDPGLGGQGRARLRLGAAASGAESHVRLLGPVGGDEKLRLRRVGFNRHREVRSNGIAEWAEVGTRQRELSWAPTRMTPEPRWLAGGGRTPPEVGGGPREPPGYPHAFADSRACGRRWPRTGRRRWHGLGAPGSPGSSGSPHPLSRRRVACSDTDQALLGSSCTWVSLFSRHPLVSPTLLLKLGPPHLTEVSPKMLVLGTSPC